MKPTDKTVDVSIVMPCLNEVVSLPYCIDRAKQALKTIEQKHNLTGEIVISDNGSDDGSQDLSKSLGARVVDCEDRGYGNALKFGIKESLGKYIVMADADGSYDFLQSPQMIDKLIEGYDVCMGSRFKGEIKKGAMPWKNRYIGNPVLSGILNLFFKTPVSDAHCGLRAFTREAILKIAPTSTGMEFASELVVKAQLLNLKQAEVPITLSPDRRDRKPHLRPWRDGWRHLRYLIMLSPTWLFFVPAFIMGFVGLSMFAVLIYGSHQNSDLVNFVGLKIGDHWSVIAGGLLSGGHLSLLFGISIIVQGLTSGYRRIEDYSKIIFQICQLEIMLIIGLGFVCSGFGVLAYIIYIWSQNDFGSLQMIREMVLANTLLMIGTQNIFFGFLMSSLSGNSNLADAFSILREEMDAR